MDLFIPSIVNENYPFIVANLESEHPACRSRYSQGRRSVGRQRDIFPYFFSKRRHHVLCLPTFLARHVTFCSFLSSETTIYVAN